MFIKWIEISHFDQRETDEGSISDKSHCLCVFNCQLRKFIFGKDIDKHDIPNIRSLVSTHCFVSILKTTHFDF